MLVVNRAEMAQARQDLGLSREGVRLKALEYGYDPKQVPTGAHIYQIESGRRKMVLASTLAILADVLEKTILELMSDEEISAA